MCNILGVVGNAWHKQNWEMFTLVYRNSLPSKKIFLGRAVLPGYYHCLFLAIFLLQKKNSIYSSVQWRT